MSMRNIILHEATPILLKWGYMLRTASPGNYCFCKEDIDGSMTIRFDGPRSFVRSIDVTYMIRKKHYVLSFGFSDFPGGKTFLYSQSSTSAIDNYLHDVIKMTEKEVLPYIEMIARFHVSKDEHLYQCLAQSPKQRAKQLFVQEKIPLIKNQENFRLLDDALKRMRPPELGALQSVFLQNESQVLGIAAALGELVQMGNGQKYHWGWYHPRVNDNLDDIATYASECPTYGLVSISGEVVYVDPLTAVLDVWNHAELKGHTLHRFAFF